MDLYPKLYIEKVTDIHIGLLKELNIKGLILDVDNTLIDSERNQVENVDKWCKDLQNHGVRFCIASNSNNREKVEKVAKDLGVPYILFAKKPFSAGLLKAKTTLGLSNKNIAVVGDQIFTDILGANNLDMYSILTEPISEQENIITKIKRPLENYVIKKYLESKEKMKDKGERDDR